MSQTIVCQLISISVISLLSQLSFCMYECSSTVQSVIAAEFGILVHCFNLYTEMVILHYQSVLLVLALVSVSIGYKFFQKSIPNGDRVLNPCDNTIWDGVGHLNKAGGGDRNVFGKVSWQLLIDYSNQKCEIIKCC